MKKAVFLILAILLFSQLNSFAAVDAIILKIGSPLAYRSGVIPIDGENKNIKPYISNNRTMVPLRFMAGQLGFGVEWDNNTKTVTLSKEGKTVKMQLGVKELYINDKAVFIEAPAEIMNNRIFVPLVYISDYFDKKVLYNSGILLITSKDVNVDSAMKTESLNIANENLIDSVNDDTFRSITILAEIKNYKDSCQIVDIKPFVRNYEKLAGKDVQIRAKVFQVTNYGISGNQKGLLLKSTSSSDYDSLIFVACSAENKFINGEKIYVYGQALGETYTYATNLGTNTVPFLLAKYVDK